MDQSYKVEGTDENFHFYSDKTNTSVKGSASESKNVIELDDVLDICFEVTVANQEDPKYFLMCAIMGQNSSII